MTTTAPSAATAAPHRPAHLRLDGIGVSHPGRRVLTDVSLTVAAGERTGLIGENGAGKTTLLHVAAGLLVPGTGTVHRPERTGLLHQELDLPAATTLEQVVERAVREVRALERRLAALAVGIAAAPDDPATADAYDTVLRDAERHGLWALDARIETVLSGLGLARLPRSRAVGELSGGQRRRLALAALLLARPTALLLDEPTNHLDDDAVDFLAAELDGWRGPVLLASHDRWFLDEVATGVVDLDPALGPDESAGGPPRQGTASTGGYSSYLRQRELARRRWAERFAAQGQERERLREIAEVSGREIFHTTAPKSEGRITRKFYSDRAAKTIGGRVRSARHRLAELERTAVGPPPAPLRFAGFHRGADTGADADVPLVRLTGAHVDGRLAPTDLELLVPPDTLDGYWLTPYGMPGEGSENTTYITGHSWEDRDAPFNRLSDPGLVGSEIELETGSGTLEYVVDSVVTHDKNTLKDSDIWRIVPDRLVIVSCYTEDLWGKNVVLTASPAPA